MTEVKKSISNSAILADRAEVAALLKDRQELATLLGGIVTLWTREENLKKHHRPYLKVREETGRLCDLSHERLAEINARIKSGVHLYETPKQAETKAAENSADNVGAFVDDLLTLTEYIDVLLDFIDLLEAGVDMGDVTLKYSRCLTDDLDRMMERWDKYITEYCHDGE